MLAGMDQDRLNLLVPAQFCQQRSHLHHVRPGADDAHDSQAVVGHPVLFEPFAKDIAQQKPAARHLGGRDPTVICSNNPHLVLADVRNFRRTGIQKQPL